MRLIRPVEHGDAQRAARDEGMHADVEVAALLVLLQERRPPDLLDMLGIHHALRVVLAVEPGEAEEHRVVDGVVERQVEKRLRAVGLADIVRAMVGRVVRVVDVALLEQQLAGVPAARADRPACRSASRSRRLAPAQVLALQRRDPWAPGAPTCGRRSRGRSATPPSPPAGRARRCGRA